MGIRIRWHASHDANIAKYQIQRSPSLDNPAWVHIADVMHNTAATYYDPLTFTFSFLDTFGHSTDYYRFVLVTNDDVSSVPSAPFFLSATSLDSGTAMVNHDYGSPGALRYQTQGGAPIEGAMVRAFTKQDYDLGQTTIAISTCLTDVNGNWVSPFYLFLGNTYVIEFHKDGLYGPDKVEVIV